MLFSYRVIGLFVLVAGFAGIASAQPPAAAPEGASKFRKLAPGIETTIAVNRQGVETFDQHTIVEIMKIPGLDWQPTFIPSTATLKAIATKTLFRRDVWYLEFTFKPLRMMWVDLPAPGGKFERKLIYYMVYRVKNNGQHLHPVQNNPNQLGPEEAVPLKVDLIPDTFKVVPSNTINDRFPVVQDGKSSVQDVARNIHFMPIFSLESVEMKDENGKDIDKAFLDRVNPVAVQAIRMREDAQRELLNSVEISQRPIPLSTAAEDKSVWGVATWEGVDLTMDNFSVVVEGLTNAYRRQDLPDAGSKPLAGRKFQTKQLQMFFWRPGDELSSEERTVYFGNPKVNVDYRWIWR